jgi:hypothetical protein
MPDDRSPEQTRGVGQGADKTIVFRAGPPWRPGGGFAPVLSFARAVGQIAGDDPDPHAVVGRADGASRNPKRPPGVAQGFQIKERSIEPQIAMTINVFEQAPSGSFFESPEEASAFRPEVAIIRHSAPDACDRERLARVAAGPERAVVGPSCEADGKAEAADPGEEMDLGVSPKIGSLN